MQKLFAQNKNILTIIAVSLVSTLFLYLPFLFHIKELFGIAVADSSMGYVYRNFDGLLYIVPAKTWYLPQAIGNLHLETPLPLEYFAAHLPLYPLFIRIGAFFMGFVKSMVFVNLIFTAAVAVLFYFFVKTLKLTEKPLLLALVFLFLPRFFVIRSVGAPESLFIFFLLLSVLFFEKRSYFWAGIAGGLAVATKVPGILLFPAFVLVLTERYIKEKKFAVSSLWLLLVPAGLLAVFFLYYLQYGNFFAYFNTGGVVPLVFPFSSFNFQAKWVGTAWLEENLFYFFMYTFAVITLYKSKYRSFFYFSLIFLTACTFIRHQDIARYTLPLWPFALIALEQFFTSKKFTYALLILLPAIYLYAWNFIVYNVMPVADWRPFL